ncbi:MAG: hypothetical protein QM733_04175 [Ilumatobacteraceae bacterium]
MLVLAVVVLVGCAKDESVSCAPTVGGGVACTRSESSGPSDWLKKNWWVAELGLLGIGAWLASQNDKNKSQDQGQAGPSAAPPSVQPPRPAPAVGAVSGDLTVLVCV